MPNNVLGGQESQLIKKKEFQKIEDIYIGVFFDGTNNNMNKVNQSDVAQIANKYEYYTKNKNNNIIFKPLIKSIRLISDNKIPIANFKQNITEEKVKNTKEKTELNYILATSDIYKLPDLRKGENTEAYNTVKLSNISFLTSLYKGRGNPGNFKVFNVYMEGSGATVFLDDKIILPGHDLTGLALGIGVTGVVSIVSRAMLFIHKYLESLNASIDKNTVKLHFDVFGFSRGATCARVFSYMICEGENTMNRGKEFELYLKNTALKKGNKIEFIKDFKEKTVDFLGIYDTVASIGMLEIPSTDNFFHPKFVPCREGFVVNNLYNKLIEEDEDNNQETEEQSKYIVMKYTKMEVRNNFHRDNVKNYGLYINSSKFKSPVKNVLHIGAIDEYRENFAFTNIGSKVPDNAIEVVIPGCHSDIGGGYIDDESNLVTLSLGRNLSEISQEEKNNNNVTKISLSYPGENEKCEILTINKLQEMGWIWINNKGNNIISNSFTGKYADKPADDYDKIQFNNLGIAGGYSNIPLSMMVNQVEKDLKERHGVFNQIKSDGNIAILNHPRIKIPSNITTDMVQKLLEKCSKGNRYCFGPGEFTSEDYQKLRQRYLHFTATDEFNLGITNQNWGNTLGANAPYRKNGVLGRLMYMGGKNDGNKLQFMNGKDCESNFIKVNVEIKVIDDIA